MTPEQAFSAAEIARFALPAAVAILLVLTGRPRKLAIRLPLAVFAGWCFGVLFVAYVYNPAGIALGHASGEHFPENRFDNNTNSVQLITGWVVPLGSVLLTIALRAIGRVAIRSLSR